MPPTRMLRPLPGTRRGLPRDAPPPPRTFRAARAGTVRVPTTTLTDWTLYATDRHGGTLHLVHDTCQTNVLTDHSTDLADLKDAIGRHQCVTAVDESQELDREGRDGR